MCRWFESNRGHDRLIRMTVFTDFVDEKLIIELDNVIDGALALPGIAELWQVAGSNDDKRMALLFKAISLAKEEDSDPDFLTAVAARAVDRLDHSFQDDQGEKILDLVNEQILIARKVKQTEEATWTSQASDGDDPHKRFDAAANVYQTSLREAVLLDIWKGATGSSWPNR